MSSIQVSTWSTIAQNTSVTTAVPNAFNFDYELVFDGVDPNLLFASRTYQQSADSADAYNIALTINADQLWAWANSNQVTISPFDGTITTTGLVGGSITFGERLLEIMAIKIFGHARARAAIVNDSSFTSQSLITSLASSMNSALSTDKNNLFGQYVNLDLVQTNNGEDISSPAQFNFSALDMVFPVALTGSLDPSTGAGVLLNGPAVGGNILSSGNYNVPLRVVFRPSA